MILDFNYFSVFLSETEKKDSYSHTGEYIFLLDEIEVCSCIGFIFAEKRN